MKARPVELASRTGNIFWYSGALYQRLTAATAGNSRMTTRFGSGPPSISSVVPPWGGSVGSHRNSTCGARTYADALSVIATGQGAARHMARSWRGPPPDRARAQPNW